MSKSVDKCVRKLKNKKNIDDTWAICYDQYNKKKKNTELNTKLVNKLNKMYNKLDK